MEERSWGVGATLQPFADPVLDPSIWGRVFCLLKRERARYLHHC